VVALIHVKVVRVENHLVYNIVKLKVSFSFCFRLILLRYIFIFILVSKPAPSFEGIAAIKGEFKEIRLSDFKDKYLVLLFYPLDL
jgi:hypothetical protein